ncbi:MAG: 5'-nucleotidase C-terminal domain-containing protein [Candidatus Gastranaerophilales bacterium]|nr:5'-nucleotidase C-terminal domain-containing protein [Candidatus Gastranaerophilales bacterium]
MSLQSISSTDTRAKIFYFNDLHANVKGAKKIKTASDIFERQVQNSTADTFKFVGGDTYIGAADKSFAGLFLNSLNIDGSAFGNHEFDMGSQKLSGFVDTHKFPFFNVNFRYKDNCSLQDDIDANRVVRSSIIEKNGNKYGVLGAAPTDMLSTISSESANRCKDFEVMHLDDTVKEIQKEIDSFKKQGINKIILLSHLGADKDKIVARQTEGIDVIVGGHSHHTLSGVVPNENYLYSKSQEPVLILQAGQNGEHYGVLDVVFDKDGKIKMADNKVNSTKELPESSLINYVENMVYGYPVKIATFVSEQKRSVDNLTEHPMSCFVADAIRKKSGAQIAFHNKMSLKTDMKAGEVTNRDLEVALPYVNAVYVYKMSEKDIIDALNTSVRYEGTERDKIGNLQVSGMKYTIGKDKNVKEVYVLNDDGTQTKLNEKNPSTDKFFTVTYGSFFAGGPERMTMLKAPDKLIKNFEWNDLQAVEEHLKSFGNTPVDIKKEGRITIE